MQSLQDEQAEEEDGHDKEEEVVGGLEQEEEGGDGLGDGHEVEHAHEDHVEDNGGPDELQRARWRHSGLPGEL